MTLRTRLTLLVAATVAIAVTSISLFSYVTARRALRSEVDMTLLRSARTPITLAAPAPARRTIDAPGAPGLTDDFVLFNVLAPGGARLREGIGGAAIPLAEEGEAVVAGERAEALYDAHVDGVHMRVAVVGSPGDKVLVVARPLTEVDNTMRRLGTLLALLSFAGVAAAATVGRAVARTGLAPVDRLTEEAERISRTRDLRAEIPETGKGEIGRLARSFNTMLRALDTSQRRQRELVSDASHELRTPLTSLRTNLDLLARADAMPGRLLPAEDRRAMLADVRAQLDEMTHLVDDLTTVARDGEVLTAPVPVDLAHVVAQSIERARRRSPGNTFHADLTECFVDGQPALLERAVTNVLDNAVKWSPPGSQIDVAACAGEIVVRDRGPGIAEIDRPHVFGRFYRAASARTMPGSGLGLAIVHDVMRVHGGSAQIESAPDADGGAVVRLRFPVAVHSFS